MPEEFEGDLTAAVFWGADLPGAWFRDVNLTDVRISHSWLVDVEIDAFIDRVVVNGVDVTAYVNEHDPLVPASVGAESLGPREHARRLGCVARSMGGVPRAGHNASLWRTCMGRSTASGPSCRRCGTWCSRWTSGSPHRSLADGSIRSGCPTAA